MDLDIKKPVFILCQGRSVERLDKWIFKLKDLDVYWASFNRFDLIEPILKKANLHIDILYLFNPERIRQSLAETKKFLSLGDGRVAIVNNARGIKKVFDFLQKKHATKIIESNEIIENGTTPHFLEALLKLGFKRICLFGYDGSMRTSDWKDTGHYKQEHFINDKCSGGFGNPTMIMADTLKMNDWGAEYFDRYDAEIKNCNLKSKIYCFPRIDYKNVKELYK